MGIENIMFLALGFLTAGLLAIAITPAIVRRAVRLTRRRIEAATPMTLNEFRADKDKLRAEFAIATRRAELQRERLRDKIAAQAVMYERATSELAALRTERDEQFDAIRSLQNQIEELRSHIGDLTRQNEELAGRLREAEHAYPAFSAGAALDSGVELESRFDPETLSGHYDQDVEDLLMALGLERQRADLYRGQVQSLVARIDAMDDERPARKPAPAAPLPEDDELGLAQARIQSAESSLQALLNGTAFDTGEGRLLAEELSLADDLETLRARVEHVEDRVLSDYRTRRFEPGALRAELKAIASDVSALLYAADSEEEAINESLFERIRKFAGDTFEPIELETGPRGSPVADRMAALRELRGS